MNAPEPSLPPASACLPGQGSCRREMEVSLQAGEIVGRFYEALLRQSASADSAAGQRSLNALCVRLVFCLYADDAGVFGQRGMFHAYLHTHRAGARSALAALFRVLDTRPAERPAGLADDLAAFPYVNGGLFAEDGTTIPPLSEGIVALILQRANEDFDWSMISPTIFGALFESTLNPETRRSGGMHYTSLENIHKLIDPLFLDELRAELAAIRALPAEGRRMARLRAYQEKLAGLRFLDPACGSGNFLTETYLCLRRLENEVISLLNRGQGVFALEGSNPIRVSIGQFYGIEIHDFAVTVARTALWIAESQMLRETEAIVRADLDFLPLKSYLNIVEGNALRMDWEQVVAPEKLDYLMGNPPFVGYTYQSPAQKEDLQAVEPGLGRNIDYVAGWYFKAARFMQGSRMRAAFVSTNSITQGEQVAGIWQPLQQRYGIERSFAHRTFRWDSEASNTAQVHCVIIGFCPGGLPMGPRRIYTHGVAAEARNINAYLLDAPDMFLVRRPRPLCRVPAMCKGSQPTDGGHLIIRAEEYEAFLAAEPEARPYVRPFLGADEFLKGKKRYCLWLADVPEEQLAGMPAVLARVQAVRALRLASKKAATRKWADAPALFTENRQPATAYIAVPEVSSERRRYVPMGFMTPQTICSNKLQLIPGAGLYHFGVLTSAVHMGWMRAICGRLKSDYDYSGAIVYNNFPWPRPSEAHKTAIEATAQGILDARALYPGASLARLYDEATMPPELRRAHQANDCAVAQAYGFGAELPESAMVAELMTLCQQLMAEQ